MLSFPPLLCRKKYQTWNDEITKSHEIKSAKEEIRAASVKVPCAKIYDVDNEHNYIMTKALKSYKLHRDKEKAETRQRQLRSAYRRRWHAPVVPSKLRASSASSQVRPKTAVDVIREVEVANTEERILRRPTPVELARITISMGESPKQINFQRRNRSTWMSHSFPSASYLNQYAKLHQLSQSRVESIPAAGKPTASRPQSAHAYDGGVFSPTGPKNDYYVIHPEWVSEAMTIQKLNLKRRPNTLVMSASDTWPGRRCKSAPPQNRSNPITWDSSNQPDQV
eukprot:XP_011451441.1 PREDICTED: uncharacterized protein LOC105345101 isoform X1 [Crassostrea gigas]